MQTLWFILITFMLSMYVMLDGFDLGAGVIHLSVGKTNQERKTILRTIGPGLVLFWLLLSSTPTNSVERRSELTRKLAERVCKDVGDAVREARHDVLPIEHVIDVERRGRPVDACGAPHVDLLPLRPDDPH